MNDNKTPSLEEMERMTSEQFQRLPKADKEAFFDWMTRTNLPPSNEYEFVDYSSGSVNIYSPEEWEAEFEDDRNALFEPDYKGYEESSSLPRKAITPPETSGDQARSAPSQLPTSGTRQEPNLAHKTNQNQARRPRLRF